MVAKMIEKISRSEQKRLFKKVEELAGELADLGPNELKTLPAEEEVREIAASCRALKGGARKRQVKYLAKVLRESELDAIYAFLQERKGSELKANLLLHQAERWRDVIINEAIAYDEADGDEWTPFDPDFPSAMIADALEEMPALDETDLRRCVDQYVRTRNKAHYRELFRMLKAAIEARERSGATTG